MKYLVSLLILLAFSFSPVTAKAQDLLSFGVGWYDMNDDHDAADFRLEYRWDDPLIWVIEPWAGLEVTSDAAVYGVGGILADIKIGNGFLITPSFGAGLYADGDGKDLGHVVEFRSQLEMGWELENQSRLGVAFGHISNAGLDDSNQGTEILNVYYHMPVDFF